MGNIVGPHGPGVNETTSRPNDTDSGNPLDTWFKDCTNGVPGSGTKVPAVWLNKVCALFRQAIRGRTQAGEQVELADDMLLRCFRDPANIGNGAPIIKQYNATSRQYELRSLEGANGVTVGVSTDGNKLQIIGPSPEGDPTIGANVGAGAEVYKDKSGDALRFRTVVGVNGVTVTEQTDTIEVGLAGQINAWLMVKRQRFTLGGDTSPDVSGVLWAPAYTPAAEGNLLVIRAVLRLDASAASGDVAGVTTLTVTHGLEHNASGSYADLVAPSEHLGLQLFVSSVESNIIHFRAVVPLEGDISPSPAGAVTLRVKGSASGGSLILRAGSTVVVEEYAYKSIGINAT